MCDGPVMAADVSPCRMPGLTLTALMSLAEVSCVPMDAVLKRDLVKHSGFEEAAERLR